MNVRPGISQPVDPLAAKQRAVNAAFLRAHPICCVKGCGRRAEHADHIQTRRAAPHLRFAWSNLQPLCHHHHSLVTRAFDDGNIRGACDVDGNTLDPAHPWAQPDNSAAIAAANAPPQKADPRQASILKQRWIHGERSKGVGR